MPNTGSVQTRRRLPDHYEVLQLSHHHGDPQLLAKEDVKTAYHRALLLHHPDKLGSSATLNDGAGLERPVYSIDQISTAYEVLSDPARRTAYDDTLRRKDQLGGTKKEAEEKGTHIGVETLDLEDMEYDEAHGVWSKGCRCGHDQGYRVTEAELERESQYEELFVGCRGCSLYIKVLFSTDEEAA